MYYETRIKTKPLLKIWKIVQIKLLLAQELYFDLIKIFAY